MKKELIKLTGKIIESLPGIQFKVQLEDGKIIRAYLSGKMNRNKILILPDNFVTIEVASIINIENQIGRIIFRK